MNGRGVAISYFVGSTHIPRCVLEPGDGGASGGGFQVGLHKALHHWLAPNYILLIPALGLEVKNSNPLWAFGGPVVAGCCKLGPMPA